MSKGLIKRIIGDNFISRFVSKIISTRYLIVKQRKINILRKNGKKTIQYLQSVLNEKTVKFFFDMGTLLGIIREGHLLGYDLDIDIGVCMTNANDKEDLRKYLESRQCKLFAKFYVEELGVIEYSFIYNNIKFDITFYHNVEEKSICHLFYREPANKSIIKVVELSCPIINEIQKYKWDEIEINVPHNPECYLKNRYGDNWRIPDKNYIYWKGPSTHPTNYIGNIEKFEK